MIFDKFFCFIHQKNGFDLKKQKFLCEFHLFYDNLFSFFNDNGKIIVVSMYTFTNKRKVPPMNRYKHFDPVAMARRSLNYITTMVDPSEDNLPYWLILPNKKPAEAAHCRVDDAELIGSWYEGLDSVQQLLGTTEGSDKLASFQRHLLSSWGEHGLRFHKKYP